MKERIPSIQLNMMMNALLTLSSIVFPVITLPYVTRVLGAEGVGRVYFASSVITFLAVFAELGIPVYGIRACARVRDDHILLSRTVREIMTINVAACAAVYLVFAVLIVTVPRFHEDRLLLVIMSSSMLLNAAGAEWLYKALEKYTYITVRSLLFKLTALIAMFALVRDESDCLTYGCITIFAASASNIVNFCNLHRYADLRPDGRADLRQHLPGMMMLFALAAATTVYTSLDLAILGIMKGNAEAGLYGVSVKIKLVIVSLVTSVSSVLLPRNSFYFEKNRRNDFFRLLSLTMRLVFMVSVPAACYFMVFARESIMLLAGAAFSGSVMPMQIIMPSVILIGISNIIGMQMLVPQGREKEVVKAALLGAAVDLVLNIVLIPEYASCGAAAATLAAEMCVTLYMIYASGKEGCALFRDLPYGAVIIASAAASIAARLLVSAAAAEPAAGICISAISFAGIYAAVMYASVSLKNKRFSRP